MSNVINSWWYTMLDGISIGIVKTDTGRFYIGKCRNINEKDDTDFIKDYGTPFHPEVIK